MKKILNWIVEHPNRTMFLVPIILVAIISISHVVSWYDIANPINWAIYLSIAIEVGAMTALVAATNKIKGGVWFMFGLITFIQMIGNIYFSFKEIDVNGELFKSWVELTSPVWEMLGSDMSDMISAKRWLAFLEGGLLPVISLTSLHFFTKYDAGKIENNKEIIVEKIVEVPVEIEKVIEVPIEVEKIVEVPVEKEVIVEKIVEVPVEKIVRDESIIGQLMSRIGELEKMQPKTIEIEKIVEVPVEKIVEIEKIVEVPVYITEEEKKDNQEPKRLTYEK
jgi:hypothetical protein